MQKSILILISFMLIFSSAAYAELHDPTQPPGFITEGANVISVWQLDAVILAKNRQVAVINGQTVQLNEQIGGNRLVNIQPNSVQLEGSDGKMTLFLLDSSLKMNSTAD
jgi:TPP-dependent pyruvate/acetoin dehydrogenase alpha subunit